MSAAATAAGYLYASGRLRGRGAREQEEHKNEQPRHEQPRTSHKAQKPEEPREPRERIRVAVLEEKPRRAPKIEYRTRKRWTAGA
jgi:hypothetical protein